MPDAADELALIVFEMTDNERLTLICRLHAHAMDAVNHLRLTVHPSQIRPTLRALLHAIFFHRLTDNIEPDTIEVCDTHIASNPSGALDKEVNTRVEEFCREYVDKGATSGEIAVVLLQRRPRKGWFAITEELVPWEEHLITLSFPPIRYGTITPPNVLPGALMQLLTFCAEKSGNVPPLTGSEGATNISYQILIAPPPPSELFSPSPPLHPTRLTSPPPGPSTRTTPATAMALAHDMAKAGNTAVNEVLEVRDASVGREGGREAREAREGREGREGRERFDDTRRASSPALGGYGDYVGGRERDRSSGGYGGLQTGGGVGGGAGGGQGGLAGPGGNGGNGGNGGAMGYFEQAKDGLRAVGARAGAVAGWTGRSGGKQ